MFIVSIRKDIDNGTFKFPQEVELKIRLKDMLEDNVDEKYYLSEQMIESIINWKAHQKPFEKVLGKNSISPTLTARGAGENHSGMVIYSNELEQTTNVQDKLFIKNANKKGYDEAYDGDAVNLERPNSTTRRGRVEHSVAQTLDTSCNQGVVIKKDNLWTSTQAKMITPEGNIKRYIGSDIIDLFGEGQIADISFPNGYNKANRVHNVCPTINTTTTPNSFVVKVPLKRGYETEVNNEQDNTTDIDVIGNYSKSDYNATPIVGKNGIVPTIRENHGQVTAIVDGNFSEKSLQKIKDNIRDIEKCSATITANPQRATIDNGNLIVIPQTLRIRKLTPKECFRLMGFEDQDVDKVIAIGTSNTQLYKQAGNSIVVKVLEHLFENIMPIIKEEKNVNKVEEKKIITYTTDKLIDLAALLEKEPDLFEELCKDYPCENATYVYEVKKGA